jgi:GntR family transcriptional repressor for pyruvate dehydrogenase complex
MIVAHEICAHLRNAGLLHLIGASAGPSRVLNFSRFSLCSRRFSDAWHANCYLGCCGLTSQTSQTKTGSSMSMPNIAALTLQRQILSGAYKAGQMLPGQRDLAESLGISRASLREALSTLEALGFIRSIPGKGTLVTLGRSVSANKVAGAPSSEGIHATFQLRFALEPAAAALAARAVNAHTAPRLWDTLARFEEALKTLDLVSASNADLEFHQLIAELTGNSLFLQVAHDFEDHISHSRLLPFADHSRIWEPAKEHHMIAAAISAGDADGARQAMQKHLLNTAARAGIEFVPP